MSYAAGYLDWPGVHLQLPARRGGGRSVIHRHASGRVMGYIPLRNRRKGSHTHVGEGMTEYTLDGEQVGYGLSEYLDQPDDQPDDQTA